MELWVVCFLVHLNRCRVESKPEHCRARLTWVLPTLRNVPRPPPVSHRLVATAWRAGHGSARALAQGVIYPAER